MHIFWDYTKECNLRCIHCYNASERAASSPDISTASKIKLVKDLAKTYPRSTLHFLGGEPLVSNDFQDVCDAALTHGLFIEITTNGTQNKNELVSYLYGNCSIVHLSLDGPTEELNDKIRGKGVFSAVKKFLSEWENCKASKQSALLDVSFTVTSLTVESYKEIVEFCLNYSIDTLTIQPIKLLGNAIRNKGRLGITAKEYVQFAEHIAKYSLGEPLKIYLTGGSKKLKEHIKWNFYNDIVSVESQCDAGKKQLRITSAGIILPCIMGNTAPSFIQRDWRTESTTISTITHSVSFNEFTSRVHKASVTTGPGVCEGCEYLKNRECYPGCPVQKVFGPAKLCEVLNENLVYV